MTSMVALLFLVLIVTAMVLLGEKPAPFLSLPGFGFTLIAWCALFVLISWADARKQVNIKREAAMLGMAWLTFILGHVIGICAQSALGLGMRPALAVATLCWLSLLAVLGHGLGFWNLRPQTPPLQAASS